MSDSGPLTSAERFDDLTSTRRQPLVILVTVCSMVLLAAVLVSLLVNTRLVAEYTESSARHARWNSHLTTVVDIEIATQQLCKNADLIARDGYSPSLRTKVRESASKSSTLLTHAHEQIANISGSKAHHAISSSYGMITECTEAILSEASNLDRLPPANTKKIQASVKQIQLAEERLALLIRYHNGVVRNEILVQAAQVDKSVKDHSRLETAVAYGVVCAITICLAYGLTITRSYNRAQQTRNDAIRSLAQHKMLLEKVNDFSPSVFVVFDAVTRRRIFDSKHLDQILGYTAAGNSCPAETTIDALIHPEDLPLFYEKQKELARCSDREAVEADYRVMGADGSYKWFHATDVVFARDEEGRPAQILGTIVDISERRRRDEEMRLARDTAEAASRAKSEFLANMSHELRTPLNGVIGMASLLKDSRLDEDQRECADIIHSSAQNLLKLIHDILDFSKIEAGQLELRPTTFRLTDCIEGLLDVLLVAASEKDIDLSWSVNPDVDAHLIGDADRLHQVLLNLCGNAVKFTDEGEVSIRVSTESQTADKIKLRFGISDTGIGIPEKGIDRLFQSFSQIDSSMTRRYGGTGLGLAISRSLVSLMGGEIGVSSVWQEGSTFWFTAEFLRVEPSVKALEPLTTYDKPCLLIGGRLAAASNLQAILAHLGCKVWTTETLDIPPPGPDSPECYEIVMVNADVANRDATKTLTFLRSNPMTLNSRLVLMAPFASLSDWQKLKVSGYDLIVPRPIKLKNLRPLVGECHQTAELSSSPSSFSSRTSIPGGGKVLIAEDNPVNQKVAERLLERLGYVSVSVGDGLEAVDALAREDFDLILMDLQMPNLDGLEATMAIRTHEESRGGHIPIIAMTAHAIKGDREMCLEAGMDDYLTKPIRVDDLKKALSRCTSQSVQKAA